jgi:hypothetical protein
VYTLIQIQRRADKSSEAGREQSEKVKLNLNYGVCPPISGRRLLLSPTRLDSRRIRELISFPCRRSSFSRAPSSHLDDVKRRRSERGERGKKKVSRRLEVTNNATPGHPLTSATASASEAKAISETQLLPPRPGDR